MKQLTVNYHPQFKPQSHEDWKSISPHEINQVNWATFPYQPEVQFRIIHDGKCLYIKYDIKEKQEVRTVCQHDQDPVYQDSCVEFFFKDTNDVYHNFEFNSQGICLSASGKERQNRQARNAEELSSILRITYPVKKIKDSYHWTLIVGIPFVSLGIARKRSYRANFYKCGDLTKEAHYLSWNNIKTIKPDFHQPEYFGHLLIE